mmetsp:Transcript_29638/g.64493  ORF Transcript_29638/g.64493 Transcript_29638/m.64493 type:complete len:307 (-) Transcript_29638:875-1795(-)
MFGNDDAIGEDGMPTRGGLANMRPNAEHQAAKGTNAGHRSCKNAGSRKAGAVRSRKNLSTRSLGQRPAAAMSKAATRCKSEPSSLRRNAVHPVSGSPSTAATASRTWQTAGIGCRSVLSSWKPRICKAAAAAAKSAAAATASGPSPIFARSTGLSCFPSAALPVLRRTCRVPASCLARTLGAGSFDGKLPPLPCKGLPRAEPVGLDAFGDIPWLDVRRLHGDLGQVSSVDAGVSGVPNCPTRWRNEPLGDEGEKAPSPFGRAPPLNSTSLPRNGVTGADGPSPPLPLVVKGSLEAELGVACQASTT